MRRGGISLASRRRPTEKGKGAARTSRRKFLGRVAYIAPAIVTFVATRAHAQTATCNPAQCRPATCGPGDCGPSSCTPPCAPAVCRPNN